MALLTYKQNLAYAMLAKLDGQQYSFIPKVCELYSITSV